MFRTMTGFKGQYHYLKLLVVSEFNEWRILVEAPNGIIHGSRQFSESKAKDHAVDVARHFIQDYKHESLPVLPSTEWTPTSDEDWMVWS